MRTPPFTASAAVPYIFTPQCQDVERYQREQPAALDKRAAALEARYAEYRKEHGVRAPDVAPDAEELVIIRELEQLAADREVVASTIETLKERWKGKPQRFILSVATSLDRDTLQNRLVDMGLQEVRQEVVRATMIEALWRESWAEPGEDISPEENEARAEQKANFIESYWQRQEAHEAAIARWREQEVERTIDELEGAPARERLELPAPIVTRRETAQAELLIDRMMRVPALRALIARNNDFARQNALCLIRLHLLDVENIELEQPLERDPRTRTLTKESVEMLREHVDDQSWHELISYIDGMYSVDGREVKNSVSPPSRPSPPDGLIEQSGGSAGSDGASTGSNTTPAPDAGSAKTTGKSSRSGSGSETDQGSKANASQTAEA